MNVFGLLSKDVKTSLDTKERVLNLYKFSDMEVNAGQFSQKRRYMKQ